MDSLGMFLSEKKEYTGIRSIFFKNQIFYIFLKNRNIKKEKCK